MRSVNEVAREMFAGLHHDCHGCDEGCCCDCYVAGIMPAVVEALVKRDAEVRAATLAEFTWQHDEREWRPDNPLIPRGRNNGVKWAARRLVGPWESEP